MSTVVDSDVTAVCALCAVAQPTMELLAAEPGSRIVAYLDSELIALLEPGVPGVMLAPRSHVKGLSTSPGLSAVFLAALRRAVTEVQSSYGTSGAMIEPSTEVPGAAGHVCYHVVPTLRDESSTPPEPDLLAEARGLAVALSEQPSIELRPVPDPWNPSADWS
jgi:hypothetical protein